MNIIQQKVINGVLAEDKDINRKTATHIASLGTQVDRMVELAAFLFTEAQDPNSPYSAEYIADITTRFQAELQKLYAIMPKLSAIASLGHADIDVATTNLASLISTYNCDPATYANKYK